MSAEAGTAPVRLAWDSESFGFEVFTIPDPCADADDLAAALDVCRIQGASLVYWSASAGRTASPVLLERYSGSLVDVKVTYGRDLGSTNVGSGSPEWKLAPSLDRDASPELVELALASGEFSRFRVDPRMPTDVFRSLYVAWIRRSCRHEIADVVLEARSKEDALCGMVTVGVDGARGSIGLIAVSSGARGKGLGRALVAGAQRWMRSRGAEKASVVTQKANRAACLLYESCGYEAVSEANVHHFWLR